MSGDAFDLWFWFDRPLDDGHLVVDRILEEEPSITAGERRFLELARDTCVRLYEVIDVSPVVSVTLRDALDSTRVSVHEKMGSRQLKRSDLLATRIIRPGASGQPEMEAGLLQIPLLLRESVVSQLSSHRAELHRDNPGARADVFFKEMPPFFHAAWASAILDPPIPQLQNTDGEEVLFTRVHFDVLDLERLTRVLDEARDLEREESVRVEVYPTKQPPLACACATAVFNDRAYHSTMAFCTTVRNQKTSSCPSRLFSRSRSPKACTPRANLFQCSRRAVCGTTKRRKSISMP
jgi:hypothetical protein